MSRIYFHSPSVTAEIYGTERALMGCLCDQIGAAILDAPLGLAKFLPPNAFPLNSLTPKLGSAARFREAIGLWMRHGTFIVDGQTIDAWGLSLNTVLAIGNDPLKLFARLHAQCEVHCYVEGRNREWLAAIIDEGIRLGIYRDFHPADKQRTPLGQWTKLASMLRSRNDEPVVCSYSVCDEFPNARVAANAPEGDAWYDLPDEEKWSMAMDGLRASDCGLELRPDDWSSLRFNGKQDAFWLLARVKADEDRKQIEQGERRAAEWAAT